MNATIANHISADSHYSPPESGSAPIRRGDLVLLDLWARLDEPDAVYYDITCLDETSRSHFERGGTIQWK